MDVPTWREVARVGALSEFVRQTDDLKWSKRLLLLLLEELHITDEFDRFVGPPKSLPAKRWPQAVAFAVALRHSWQPNDLDDVRAVLAGTGTSARSAVRGRGRRA